MSRKENISIDGSHKDSKGSYMGITAENTVSACNLISNQFVQPNHDPYPKSNHYSFITPT